MQQLPSRDFFTSLKHTSANAESYILGAMGKVPSCKESEVVEMKSVNENYFKSSIKNFQKSLPFREIYVKYLEKNSIQV